MFFLNILVVKVMLKIIISMTKIYSDTGVIVVVLISQNLQEYVCRTINLRNIITLV